MLKTLSLKGEAHHAWLVLQQTYIDVYGPNTDIDTDFGTEHFDFIKNDNFSQISQNILNTPYL